MEALEAQIFEAVETGVIPGVVLLAANSKGTFSYSRSFGHLSVREPRSKEPLTHTTVLRLASTSKLITQVCALQCVERGLIGLDDDVRDIVPDLKDIQVFTAFNGDTPVYEDVKRKITLRNLLTHSSGLPYTPLDPLLIQYRKVRNEPVEPKGTFNDQYLYPLTVQPDDRWIYSPGMDWAGRTIEILTGLTLHEFVQQNIAKPLGSDSMTFFVQSRPDLLARRSDFTARNSETKKLEYHHEYYFDEDPKECFGGWGIWGTAQDLFEVCRSILADDGRLLKTETINEAFRPQLNDRARESMAEFLKNKDYDRWGMGGGFQYYSKRDASLFGSILIEENENTPRKTGCAAWIGYPNVFYFIDRKADLCGVFAAQIVPPGDPETLELHLAWEKAIYAERERVGAT